jgi:hypothetical protein
VRFIRTWSDSRPFKKKNAPKMVLFLPEKSAFWPKKSENYDVSSFSLPQKAKKVLEIFLKYRIFSNKS